MEAMTFPAPGAVTLEISIGAGDVRVREQAGAVSLQITGEQDPDQVTIESSEEPDGSLRVTVTLLLALVAGHRSSLPSFA